VSVCLPPQWHERDHIRPRRFALELPAIVDTALDNDACGFDLPFSISNAKQWEFEAAMHTVLDSMEKIRKGVDQDTWRKIRVFNTP
jgi:hypothetical protein